MADNSWEDELAWAGEWASNAHQQEGSMFQEHPEPHDSGFNYHSTSQGLNERESSQLGPPRAPQHVYPSPPTQQAHPIPYPALERPRNDQMRTPTYAQIAQMPRRSVQVYQDSVLPSNAVAPYLFMPISQKQYEPASNMSHQMQERTRRLQVSTLPVEHPMQRSYAQAVHMSPDTVQSYQMKTNTTAAPPGMRTAVHPHNSPYTRQPLQSRADPLQTSDWITGSTHRGQASLKRHVSLSKENLRNVNQHFGRRAPTESVCGYLQERLVPGERSGPTINSSLLTQPGRSDMSPTVTEQSSDTRSRRSKNEMLFGNFTHRCAECDAGFDSPDLLRHHKKNVHTAPEDRPHICTICGQKRLYPKDLERHVLDVHSPDRPHKCPAATCKYSIRGFKRADQLKRHLDANAHKPAYGGQASNASTHTL